MADPRLHKVGAKHNPNWHRWKSWEWRQKQKKDPTAKAMYHSDDVIVSHFNQHGSMSKAALELGVTFYTVRAVLQRNGITPPKRGKKRN